MATGSQQAAEQQRPQPGAVRRHGWLLAALAFYVLCHFGYGYVSPLLKGPDEPEHLQYIRSLAVNHELPLFDFMRNNTESRPMVVHTALHGPVYYGLMVPFYLLAQPFGEDAVVTTLRQVNGLLGLGLIFLVYAACRAALGDGIITRGTTAATALHPLTIYLAGHVTNDILAAICVAWVFNCLAHIVSGGKTQWWLGVGIGIAVGLVTKYTTIIVLAPALVLLWVNRARYATPAYALPLCLLALAAPTLSLDWPWFLRNLHQHGELFVLQHDLPALPAGPAHIFLNPGVLLFGVLYDLFQTALTFSGPLWLFRLWGDSIYWLTLLWVPLIFWPLSGWVRRWRRGTSLALPQKQLVTAAALALAVNLAGIVNTCLFEQSAMTVFGGRFLIASIPWIMLLCVLGVAGWNPDEKGQSRRVVVFCTILAAQNLWMIPAIWGVYSGGWG